MARSPSIQRIRNIGIIAHVDAGKTTTTERILYYTGKIHKIGEVDDGTTVTDWMEQERERGITITSAATTVTWNNQTINIIDTPGHIDFTVEVERSLRVLDGVIVVFCGVGGVEPQSEKVWRQADTYHLPRIAYVNKLDRIGASFENVVAMMRERLGGDILPLQYPVGEEAGFEGVVDLLENRTLRWLDPSGETYTTHPGVPDELRPVVARYQEALVEKLAECDDALLTKYMDGVELGAAELRSTLRRMVLAGRIYPVLCGSSLKNKGVQPLLDAVVDYFPSPEEAPLTPAENLKTGQHKILVPDPDGPLVLYVFKVMYDQENRLMSYARLYSGTLRKGAAIYNTERGCFDRMDRLLRLSGNKKEPIDLATPGDIVGIIGLKTSVTGVTFSEKTDPWRLPLFTFTEPIVSMAIEPKSVQDQDRLVNALELLVIEDPSFLTRIDRETGQTIILGMGELHLEIIVDRLSRQFRVEVRVGKPQVSFRESISTEVSVRHTVNRQEGNKSLAMTVELRVYPAERGNGYLFSCDLPAEHVPRRYVELVRDSLRDALITGISLGYPIVDIGVDLLALEYRESEVNDMIVRIAAIETFTQATLQAFPILLEPIMSLDIMVPKEYLGGVVEDINARRGTINNIGVKQDLQHVKACLPLRRTFGYSTDLRSLTQGRATYTLLLSHYRETERESTT